MQCLEKFNVTLHRRLSVEEFLKTHPILLHLANDADLSVTDYVADGFLPDMQPGEPYGDWVVRQVRDVLSTQLWRDTAGGYENPGRGTHTCKVVERVEFDENDRQYIVNTFGAMPEVRSLWLGLPQEQAVAA